MSRFINRHILPVLICGAITLGGCSSVKPGATGWGGKVEDQKDATAEVSRESTAATRHIDSANKSGLEKESTSGNARFEPGIHTQLLDVLSLELHTWIGTPHIWGGTRKSGVDCSGLIQTVFSGALGHQIPRTTDEQRRIGNHVRRSDLLTGDLVFFKPDENGRHVGIYMANNEFIHASSSRGVMRSRLTESYWDRYYDTARRVLTNNEQILSAVAHARIVQNLRSELINE